jgi:hypothetical protein
VDSRTNSKDARITKQQQRCPKCNAPSEIGFVLDRGQSNVAFVGTWVDGPPLPAPSLKQMFGDPLHGKRQRPITGYCCTYCGYLEFFAKDV